MSNCAGFESSFVFVQRIVRDENEIIMQINNFMQLDVNLYTCTT